MDEKSYEELLERARSKLASESTKKDRFEPKEPQSNITGNRTILHNFREMSEYLEREPNHFLKFLSKELATAGTVEGGKAVFQGRFEKQTIKRLVDRYIEEFVICPVCRQPDTKIIKQDRLLFLKCDACGARSSIGKA